MSITILSSAFGVFIAISTGLYLMMSSQVLRVVVGFLIFSNGINLAILTASGLSRDAVPAFIRDEEVATMIDPLPQAFILTAIVIGMGTSVYLLAMGIRCFVSTGRTDIAPRRDDI